MARDLTCTDRLCQSILPTCGICFGFSELVVDEDGNGSGCVMVNSTCTGDTIKIGCFNQIPYVGTCASMCHPPPAHSLDS